MLPVSMDCKFLIAPSGFSNVNLICKISNVNLICKISNVNLICKISNVNLICTISNVNLICKISCSVRVEVETLNFKTHWRI